MAGNIKVSSASDLPDLQETESKYGNLDQNNNNIDDVSVVEQTASTTKKRNLDETINSVTDVDGKPAEQQKRNEDDASTAPPASKKPKTGENDTDDIKSIVENIIEFVDAQPKSTGNPLLQPSLDVYNLNAQPFNNMLASSRLLNRVYEPGSKRPIIIDGSNVAFAHGKHKSFSENGILICLKYFQQQGHSEIKIFAPRYHHNLFSREVATELEQNGLLVFTPSRLVDGKRISSYDDRFTLQYAVVKQGIVVTNDNYRDLYEEDPRYHDIIRNRLLPYTWSDKDMIMFPPDPLGRNGPTLEEFLIFPNAPDPNNNNGNNNANADNENDSEDDEDDDDGNSTDEDEEPIESDEASDNDSGSVSGESDESNDED